MFSGKAVWSLVTCAVFAAACGDSNGGHTPPSGALEVLLESDMSLPKDIDRVTLDVTRGKSSLLHVASDVGPDALRLPARFEVKSTGDPSPVTVHAVGFQNHEPRVERDAVTPIPTGHTGELRLALDYLCVGTAEKEADGSVASTCPKGSTCVLGSCQSAVVPPSQVPVYTPGAPSDAGVTSPGDAGAGGCFPVADCFAAAKPASVDLSSCVLTLADGTNAATVNVALQFPLGHAGLCGSAACWVSLTGWSLEGTAIQLPKSVCDGDSAAAKGATIVVSDVCPTQAAGMPPCSAGSSVDTPAVSPSTGQLGTSCMGAGTEPCGLCGMQSRSCINGMWSDWGACSGEGMCQPGATRECGSGGTQTCSDACQWSGCACPGSELTCGASGDCVSAADVHSCGSCDHDCTALPNVASSGITCSAGKCGYKCAPGFADCSTSGAGCSDDLSRPATCGSCSDDCTSLSHVGGSVVCKGGQCSFPQSACAAGYGDCNGDPSDGCEVALDTKDHCGACTTACSGGDPVCDATASPATCASTCTGTSCGASCVSTDTDANHCGACDTPCPTPAHGQATCASGKCGVVCNDGYSLCSGTCVDERADAANCGSCGHVCAQGVSCQAGLCACSAPAPRPCGTCNTGTQTGTCNTDGTIALACTGGANLQTDNANCGSCGNACASGITCAGGVCPCGTGATSEVCGNCGKATRTCLASGVFSAWSSCVEPTGACKPGSSQVCEANGTQSCSPQCAWGACSCKTGFSLCTNNCVDALTDTNNCGACGKICASGCRGGNCIPPKSATGIAVGWSGACAALADATVECWGANAIPGTPNITIGSVISGVSGVTAVSTGSKHACALLSNGTVECWGDDTAGELGNGTSSGVMTGPSQVSGLSGVTAISAGYGHTCALLSNGTVQCWGSNNRAQLGDGNNITQEDSPVAVSGLTNAIAISAGESHTCAVLAGGSVQCWGENNSGQLGTGSTTGPDTCTLPGSHAECAMTPVPVAGLTSGVTAVAAGNARTCALLSNGSVRCWGAGPLGDGTTTDSATPVTVVGLSGAISAIGAGANDSCALLSSGSVLCWGQNQYAALGTGNTTQSLVPIAVVGLHGATAIAPGFDMTCALVSSGSVRCWGNNGGSGLGIGNATGPQTCGTSPSTFPCATTPVEVSGL